MDAYHKYGGVNVCNDSLEVFSGIHFHIKKFLQIMNGKYSKHIINESIDTDTLACGIWWLEWSQAKNVVNFKDERINVNTITTDVFQTLEKSNLDTS